MHCCSAIFSYVSACIPIFCSWLTVSRVLSRMCNASIYDPGSILLISTQFSELCRAVSKLDIGTQRLYVSISAETQDICMVRFRRN